MLYPFTGTRTNPVKPMQALIFNANCPPQKKTNGLLNGVSSDVSVEMHGRINIIFPNNNRTSHCGCLCLTRLRNNPLSIRFVPILLPWGHFWGGAYFVGVNKGTRACVCMTSPCEYPHPACETCSHWLHQFISNQSLCHSAVTCITHSTNPPRHRPSGKYDLFSIRYL